MGIAAQVSTQGQTALRARRARRAPRAWRLYGRFVGLMKVILPTVATALLLIVVIWPYLDEQRGKFEISFTKIDKNAAESLRIVKGRYTGVDRLERPFSITAESAEQADPKSPVIELIQPKADIVMKDGSWIAITAEVGNYNRVTQFLELLGTVNLFHDKGYEFQTASAVLDLQAGDAIGTEPVHGQGPFGHLEAESFIIRNRGERIEFHGNTQLMLLQHPNYPQSDDG